MSQADALDGDITSTNDDIDDLKKKVRNTAAVMSVSLNPKPDSSSTELSWS